MSRFDNPTGQKQKYNQTAPIYGNLEKEAVDKGVLDGTMLLYERINMQKVDGKMVETIDRRFMPASEREKNEKRGFVVVELGGAERANMTPTVTKKSAKAV